MSELKWNWAYAPYLDPPENQKESAKNAGYVKVVSKDEADKVISRHKHKRCLAMAGRCRLRGRLLGACGLYEKELWALKWHKRWLELADKFKEVTR